MPFGSFMPRKFRRSQDRSLRRHALLAERLEDRWLLTADPIVTVDTNFGNFQIELFPGAAPQTVANFLSYVESGAYTNSIFHRSVPGFVEQTGGFTSPSATFTNTSQFATIPTTAPVPLEYDLPNIRGSVAMARAFDPNSATDEWFVNLVDNSQTLDTQNGGGYAVFGQVLGDGMQVLDAIAGLNVDRADDGTFASLPLGANNQLVRISSVTVGLGFDGTVSTDVNGNGQFDAGEPGVAGRTVFLDVDGTGAPNASNPSTTTDANGHYAFSGLMPGSYHVREVAAANVTISDPVQTVTLGAAQNTADVNFSEEPSLAGTVFVDLNGDGTRSPGEPGRPGQTVFLDVDGSGAPDANNPSTITDSNGRYWFSELSPGSYAVKLVSPENVSLSTPPSQSIAVTVGQTAFDVDFGELPAIAGTVFNDNNKNGRLDSGEQGLAGRTVFIDLAGTGILTANDPSAVTDANGHFAFLTLADGTYTVREALPSGLSSTTALQTVDVAAGRGSLNINLGEGPAAPNQLYVEAVYRDILARAPDSAGLAYWLQQLAAGASRSAVADALAHSDEYYANFVIRSDYLKDLDRAADDAAVAYWTSQLRAGLTDQQFEANLLASDEFYNHAGGTDAKWIDALYQSLFSRAPDATGASYWLAQLTAGRTREQLSLSITSGAELETATIDQDYLHLLGRPADPAGVTYWLGQFAAGNSNEDILDGFAGSEEYFKNHVPPSESAG